MEYRAIYSGDHISHGKFKYIDKWKSKAGNWIYKYADEVGDKARKLNDRYGPKVSRNITAGGRELKYPQGGYDQKVTRVTKNLIGGRTVEKQSAYAKSFRPSSPKLIDSRSHRGKTVWEKVKTGTKEGKARAAAGYDHQRYALYKKDEKKNGKTEYGIRTEYRDAKYDAERNRRYARVNAVSRGNKFIRKLGALNDKYGPKFKQENSHALSTGKVIVDEYTRNLIGGKTVHVESYMYDTNG